MSLKDSYNEAAADEMEAFWNIKKEEVTRISVFTSFLEGLVKLSKCTDRQTAAIITNEDLNQVYSIGINGGPAGSKHQCLCNLPGKYTCVHAEVNAIAKCNVVDSRKVMMCSLSPCVTCAATIINSGFCTVYYLDEWKDTTGIELLLEAGIAVKNLRRIL